MEYFYDYDYWQLAQALDFISWDSYPMWHRDKDETAGLLHRDVSRHDAQPEGRQAVCADGVHAERHQLAADQQTEKPGMHILSSLQAVAHGADSVQYFQWRKSRGSVEKFHGAVIDHVGHLDTRVGREVGSARCSASCRGGGLSHRCESGDYLRPAKPLGAG
jgi:beta-galactosidase